MKQIVNLVLQQKKEKELAQKLKNFSVALVLTAHPTQFYPGPVLGIINDLSKALANNNASLINIYLQQLGKTPFFKSEKPTPYDEAASLIWYLENVFYTAAGKILSSLKNQFSDSLNDNNSIIKMGFWPGGDRDGNPFVTSATTLKVADALRGSIIKSYYMDVRKLRRRLTFKGVEELVIELERQLYNNLFIPGKRTSITKKYLLETLFRIKEILSANHNGLFIHLIDQLINKVHLFGLHFATLDLRQDSSIHELLYQEISKNSIFPKGFLNFSPEEKIIFFSENVKKLSGKKYSNKIIQDTLDSIVVIKTIQNINGEMGCNRYIISHCKSALNVMEVYGLFILCGWKKENLTVDIVPLIETIDDLSNASHILESLYQNKIYKSHLKKRNNTQTVMLGFSDGTKDGGYLMGNWAIYKAKENLTAVSKKYGFQIIFFDGRGGPPARGGGKTHQFYASMGNNISNQEIQLTIQGQTVSSNFGTIEAARFNMEQLLNAGISNSLFSNKENTLAKEEELLLQKLADKSYNAYLNLKQHPQFLNYLLNISPLKYYSQTNIASRPSKRGRGKISLKDLRAVPFVGSWSQVKQNVTGYYGLGSALKIIEQNNLLADVKKMYANSLFFKTLIENCEMAMKKCYFPLTQYLREDEEYGGLWKMIYDEYELTKKYIFKITGHTQLMEQYPVEQLSVGMRERIVLPLLTIQQFALAELRAHEQEKASFALKSSFEKLVMRCSFGIINAGRNSA